jgi:hypothetical protein
MIPAAYDRGDIQVEFIETDMSWLPVSVRGCQWVVAHAEMVADAPIYQEIPIEPHGAELLNAMCREGLIVKYGRRQLIYGADC